MIVIDTSESRSTSRMPDIPGATTSTILESLSGADILVSKLGMPVTPALLSKHLEQGGILINRKGGEDMLSSIASGAINRALARMIQAGARYAWQRVIMSTGIFVPDMNTGKVLIGEPRQSKARQPKAGKTYVHTHEAIPQSPNYTAFASIRRYILLRGGSYWPLTCDKEIPRELKALEQDLTELEPVKELWPNAEKMHDPPLADDPLQELREVTDWRGIIVNMFKDVGPAKANALRNYMLANGIEDTLIQALMVIQSIPNGVKVPQWGKMTAQKVGKIIGLPEWTIVVREEYKK